MSADSSQGAFRGLRSQRAPSPTGPSNNITTRAASSHASSRHFSLSQDTSPRPRRPSHLRNVILSDSIEIEEQFSLHTASSPSTSTCEESEDLDTDDSSTHSAAMSTGERPKLKLNFSKNKPPGQETATSPAPQSALRTPSIKLHLKPSTGTQPLNAPSSSHPGQQQQQQQKKKKNKTTVNGATLGSSAKKRKQPDEDGSEDELVRKPAQVRKLTLTTKSLTAQSPITPTLKLKYKGRVPKRALGLGYDSELDEREQDPTILETFILRMPPGADCDYLRDAVQHGTIGVARSQGGADVQMKFLDRSGRRGLITIRGQRWAATLVDLPCIVEGMKSWDKKGWVKSADICQMLLVLGKVQADDEAKDFPLPRDVDPQTWQYAHGLTPPMRWVRKRRFARTNRTSVNAIEAVERKVDQLLAEDDLAMHTKFELLDHDPAAKPVSDDSGTEFDGEGREPYDEDEDEDAEGEDVGEYFGYQQGASGNVMMDTPINIESQTPQEEDGADDDFILSGLLGDQDDAVADAPVRPIINGLSVPEADTSIAITSTSPSVADTAAQTPAAAETSGGDDDSEDFDEEEEEEEEESMDDEDREATAQKQKAIDEIQELKEELQKQATLLKNTPNPILARKIRARIEQIQGDVETARKTAGLEGDAEDDEDDQ